MSMILESDILYNILLHLDLTSVGNIFRLNKFVNRLCNNEYFWKIKFETDYKNIVPQSYEWLREYKTVSFAHTQTIKFAEYMIKGDKYNSRYGVPFPFYARLCSIVNWSNLYWVPHKLRSQLHENSITSIFLAMNQLMSRSTTSLFSIGFRIQGGTPYYGDLSYIYISKEEFIKYVTKLRYDYGNFEFHDQYEMRRVFSNWTCDWHNH